MTAIKRISLTFAIVIALLIGILPSVSYGEGVLSDAQRKALVDVTVKIVQEGNKSRILRYSQGHRMVGYNWQKIQGSKKQLTSGNVNLVNDDLKEIKKILMESQGVKNVEDLYKMPTTLGYKCFFTGADIEDTIPFDCSSLCGAVYNMTVGTPYGGHAWCSGEYSKDTDWFTVTSDMSKREPGDILWKKGHVVIYLGKCFSNYTAEEAKNANVDQNKEYTAEAAGFAGIDKSSAPLRKALLDFLKKNPQYIPEHPQFNGKKPTIQFPEQYILDTSKQVLISEYKPGRFTKVAKYIGPISAGRSIDVTNLSTTNTGNNFGSGDDSNGDGNNTSNNQTGDGSITGGASHDPINLPGNYTAVWPKDMVLEDQNLATSAGYFYKGTPTYGQYVGRIDLFNWLVNAFADTMDWLTGFATYAIKAVFIGWAGIMESVMSNILNFGVTPDNTGQSATIDYDITRLEKINSAGILAYTVEDALVSRATLAGTPQISQDTNNSSGTTNGSSTNASNSNNSATNNSSNASNSNTNSSNANQATNSAAGTTTTQKPTVEVTSDIDASETKKKITVEDVLFNRVPVLDINFFDFENAGGQKLSEGSLIYKIRATIAGWYTVIRNVVIIGMLVALIYAAIKIAISQPGKKAEYKSKLIDWIVGFIIVFFIHYFMVAVIAFNNQIVKILDPVIQSKTTVDTPKVETGTNSNVTTTDDGQTSLYEAIRIQAYDIKATTGITAAIMYMVLVFLTIRFVILYAKRLFVIAVLIVISPLVGLLYSINKKKYKIGDWASEFIYNVLIQFVHVIIYTAIVGFAYELTKTSTFRGGIIALMALAFLYGAEELVKKIFGFGKASTSGSLSNSGLTQMAAFGVGKKVYDKASQKYQATKKKITTMNTEDTWLRRFYNNDIHKNTSVTQWVNKYNPPEDEEETEEEKKKRLAQQVLNSKAYKPDTKMVRGLNFYRKTEYIVDKNGVPITPYEPVDKDKSNYFNTSSINTRIEDAMKEEKKARRAYTYDAAEDFAKVVTGSFSLMASVPMLVLAPKVGIGLSAYGIHALASATGRRKIEGIKPTGVQKKWTGKKLIFAWATAGANIGIENMHNNMSDKLTVFETKYTKKVELLKEARELEDKIARDIVNIELERKTNENPFDTQNEKVKAANEKLEQVVRGQEKQEFEKAVDLTLLEVDKKTVEKAVKNCMLNKKDNGFTQKDIESISKEIIGTVEKKNKNVKINSDLSEIVREEVKNRVIEVANYVVVDAKDKKKKRNIAEESGDTATSIREKYNRKKDENLNEPQNKTSMFGRDTSKKITVTEEKENVTGKTTLHIKEQNEKPRKEITVEELDKVVDDVINDMETEELIDVIDAALKRKETIDRRIENPKLAKLMEKVQQLNNIHSTFKDLTGEEMYLKYKTKDNKIHKKLDDDGKEEYQSVSEVVKGMRDYLVRYINGEA